MWRVAGLAMVVSWTAVQAAAQPVGAAALTAAAFAPPVHSNEVAGPLAARAFAADGGAATWRSGEVRLSEATSGAIDTLRISLAEPATADAPPLRLPGFDLRPTYEAMVVRNWPAAVSFDAGRFGLDVTPHAGVGMSSLGGLAEAGAMVRLSPKPDDLAVRRLAQLGVKDGSAMGGQGRWYLFAAASGRAVGLNMLRSEGGWNKAGWTTDPSSKLVGDAQVGVGWRKGDMQSSFGVIHREVKGQHLFFGAQTRDDTVAAFTFSFRPQR